MKVFFAVFGALLITIFLTLFALPYFINWNSYKAELESLMAKAVKAEIKIEGDIELSILPTPRLKAHHLKIKKKDLFLEAHFERFDMRIALPPLLRRKIDINSLIINSARLVLNKSKYQSITTQAFQKKVYKENAINKTISFIENIEVKNISFENVDIYFEQKDREHILIMDDMRGTLSAPSLQGPWKLSNSTAFLGESPVSLALQSAKYRAQEGAAFNTSITFENSQKVLKIRGYAKRNEGFILGGTMEAAPFKKKGVENLTLKAAFKSNKKQLEFYDISMENETQLPLLETKGSAIFSLQRAPFLKIDLEVFQKNKDQLSEYFSMKNKDALRILLKHASKIIIPTKLKLRVHDHKKNAPFFKIKAQSQNDKKKQWQIEEALYSSQQGSQYGLNGVLDLRGFPSFDGFLRLQTQSLTQFLKSFSEDKKGTEHNQKSARNDGFEISTNISISESGATLRHLRGAYHNEVFEGILSTMISHEQQTHVKANIATKRFTFENLIKLSHIRNAFFIKADNKNFELKIAIDELLHNQQNLGAASIHLQQKKETLEIHELTIGQDHAPSFISLKGTINDQVETSSKIQGMIKTNEPGFLENIISILPLPSSKKAHLKRNAALYTPMQLEFDLQQEQENEAPRMIAQGRLGKSEIRNKTTFTIQNQNRWQPKNIDVKFVSSDGLQLLSQLGIQAYQEVKESPASFNANLILLKNTNDYDANFSVKGLGLDIRSKGQVKYDNFDLKEIHQALNFAISKPSQWNKLLGYGAMNFVQGAVKGKAIVKKEQNKKNQFLIDNIEAVTSSASLKGALKITQKDTSRHIIKGHLTFSQIKANKALLSFFNTDQWLEKTQKNTKIWSQKPLENGWVNQNSISLTVQTPILHVAHLSPMENVVMTYQGSAQNQSLSIKNADFAKGKVSGEMSLSQAFNGESKLTASFNLEEAKLESLKKQKKHIEGGIDLKAEFNAQGATLNALLHHLYGKVNISSNGLKIEGMDLKNLYQNEADLTSYVHKDQLQKQVDDFVRAGATEFEKTIFSWPITKGRILLQPILYSNKPLFFQPNGNIDLVNRRIEAQIDFLNEKGDQETKNFIPVSLKLGGSFQNPSLNYEVDELYNQINLHYLEKQSDEIQKQEAELLHQQNEAKRKREKRLLAKKKDQAQKDAEQESSKITEKERVKGQMLIIVPLPKPKPSLSHDP